MSFSGGVYTLPGPALVTGEVVSATENNQFRNDVAGAFNLTMLRNGTSTATANLPMGGYKLTGLGVATTSGDALSYGQAAVVSDITATGSITVNSGTANGVAYLNGSKVLTTGSALTFDGSTFKNTAGGISIQGNSTPSSGAGLEILYAGGTSLLQSYDRTGAAYRPIQMVGAGLDFTATSTNPLTFGTGGSEQMRLTSTGLGIGTSSPSQPLQVTKSQNASTWAYVTNGSNGSGAATGLLFGTDQGTSGAISQNSSGNSDVAVNALRIRNLLNAPISFEINSSTKALLDSSGNLGLGVTPSAWATSYKSIDFQGGSVASNSGYTMLVSTNAYSNGANWVYRNSNYASQYWQANGQHQWYTAPSGTAGNTISFTQAMTLDASGNLGIGTSSPAGYKLNVAGNISRFGIDGPSYIGFGAYGTDLNNYLVGVEAGSLAFYQGVYGGTSSERMRIDSSGNLLVGTTAGSERLRVVGTVNNYASRILGANTSGTFYHVAFDTGSAQVGSISSNTTTTTYATSSDYRLKENIQPMQNALDVVQQLNPVRYTWKADGSAGQGFIAHELQAVVPDCVTGEKDAVDEEGKPVYQGIDTSFLVATLTKAIQEQQEQINQLKAEVAALKGN